MPIGTRLLGYNPLNSHSMIRVTDCVTEKRDQAAEYDFICV